MAVRMLIDAAHPEETRVVVLSGNRLEEFDVETASRQVLKGNIYLAKVTRVEPSLQAAFVEYGGNRHGFIPFAEIHPDYYQIPIADRQALLAAQAAEGDDEDEDERDRRDDQERKDEEALIRAAEDGPSSDQSAPATSTAEPIPERVDAPDLRVAEDVPTAPPADVPPAPTLAAQDDGAVPAPTGGSDSVIGAPADVPAEPPTPAALAGDGHARNGEDQTRDAVTEVPAATEVESVGGDDDATEEVRRPRTRHIRSYRIQEVIKRRQILLVQVVKEERGAKGAALTTYISLAGRYCVLMPNSPRGGGVSRKIANPSDRKRLKSISSDLDVPEGMGVIVRTAGLNRSKPEIKRDFEYLLRLWDSIRELTLRSTAPALVYEEANLIKRSIRDMSHGEIDEILVEGEQGYAFARDFMATLMPANASRVKLYAERVPLFQRYQVEQQLDGIHQAQVQLRSGGTIVFGQTEALVAIDVNSGRATRERNIEETATKTNLEAAEEIARQIRLRDLAGLIVIDFIDMEDGSNNRAVERKLKESLKADRARIQVGRISPFGLLEMSRQRLRPSLQEASTNICPHCRGTGLIRSTDQSALVALRAIEDEASRDRASEISVAVPTAVALYLLNQKRGELSRIESTYRMAVSVVVDDTLVPPENRIERAKPRAPGQAPISHPAQHHVTHETVRPPELEAEAPRDDADIEQDRGDTVPSEAAPVGEDRGGQDRQDGRGPHEGGRRRRRRKRRDGGGGDGERNHDHRRDHHDNRAPREREVSLNNPPPVPGEPQPDIPDASSVGRDAVAPRDGSGRPEDGGEHRGRRRRGRRGGRRNRQGDRPDFAQGPQGGDARGAQEDRPRIEQAAPESPILNRPPVAPEPMAPRTPQSETVTETLSDAAQPKRTGWWRRTFGGG